MKVLVVLSIVVIAIASAKPYYVDPYGGYPAVAPAYGYGSYAPNYGAYQQQHQHQQQQQQLHQSNQNFGANLFGLAGINWSNNEMGSSQYQHQQQGQQQGHIG